MSDDFYPPMIWPDPATEFGFGQAPPWRSFVEPAVDCSVAGVVWGLDHKGVDLLRELLTHEARIKLIIATYPASATDRSVLEEILKLATSFKARADFRIFASSLGGNASMTALLVSNSPERGHFWIGNTANFGCRAGQRGHLNLGFESNLLLTGRFVEWFAEFWKACAPLTPTTADIPPLVPAGGSQEAQDSWTNYERLCQQLGEQADLADASGLAVPTADAEEQDALVAEICKDLQISPRDRLKERVFEIIAQGEIVTIDKSGGAPPLDLPVRAEEFVRRATTVGAISLKSSCRIRIFDEDQSKELESRRKGLSNVIQRLTYPLADGVRWIPKKAQPLLEQERTRLEKDAKGLLESLVAGGASEFAKSRREAIKHDANEMYKKAGAGSGKHLPENILNLILRDLQNRLAKATQGDFLPKVTYMSAQFSTHADSEHLSQWAQVRTLLLATARYFRESVTTTGHLKGIEVPEDELLAAMNVCGDWIVSERNDPTIVSVAKSELRRLEEIQAGDLDDRSKCRLILGMIEHRRNSD